jgi:hypothetical protein
MTSTTTPLHKHGALVTVQTADGLWVSTCTPCKQTSEPCPSYREAQLNLRLTDNGGTRP